MKKTDMGADIAAGKFLSWSESVCSVEIEICKTCESSSGAEAKWRVVVMTG
jgi:hypothetical protein